MWKEMFWVHLKALGADFSPNVSNSKNNWHPLRSDPFLAIFLESTHQGVAVEHHSSL